METPPPVKPEPKEHPFVAFNLSANGNNPDWQPADHVKIPHGLKPADSDADREMIKDPRITKEGMYVDEKTGQKLNTVWINKEDTPDPEKPITLFLPGIGTTVSDKDVQANGGFLSRGLGNSPMFMIDYPSVPNADRLTDAQKEALKNDDTSEIVNTWIDALKQQGFEGRKIQIVGESMGAFFGIDLAHALAQHPELNMTVEKIHMMDPPGIHEYHNKIEAMDAIQYMMDVSKEGAYAQYYRDNVSNTALREVAKHDVGKAKATWRDITTAARTLVLERPPNFYYGSLLAHGGLEQKIHDALATNPDLNVVITNFTNSRVCPHDELVDAVGRLKGEYADRIRAQYAPGDTHAAFFGHDRLVTYTQRAFREAPEQLNSEFIHASRSVVATLEKHIYDSFNTPENPLERRDYHNLQHTSHVRSSSRKVLEAILSDQNISDAEREKLMMKMDIAAYAHDAVQNYDVEERTETIEDISTGKKFDHLVKTRSMKSGDQPGDNEYESLRMAIQLMDAENEKAGHDVFSEHDKDDIRQAIFATIPTQAADGTVKQQHIHQNASPIARALAIGDLYNGAIDHLHPATAGLFRERNYDILERLNENPTIGDPAMQKSIKDRMERWIPYQNGFLRHLKEGLPDRLEGLTDAEKDRITQLIDFDAVEHEMSHFILDFETKKGSFNFNHVLSLFGYHDDPVRYSRGVTANSGDSTGR